MELSEVSLETRMDYNCEHCKRYWKELEEYWATLGKDIQYITLYCPACKRTKERSW